MISQNFGNDLIPSLYKGKRDKDVGKQYMGTFGYDHNVCSVEVFWHMSHPKKLLNYFNN